MLELKKIYTWLIVLYPILSIYSTGIPSLCVADAVLLLFFVVALVKKRMKIEKFEMTKTFFIFLVYILFTMLIQMMFGNVSIFSSLRYLLFLLSIICLKDLFDFDSGTKLLGFITITVSIYVIVQYLCVHTIGITLPWRIPGLPIMDNSFIAKEQSSYYLVYYRPTGIFCEPTHYAQYCLVYPCYLLFADESLLNKKKWISIIIITCGIICSGSAAGLLMIAGIFGFYYLKYVCKGQINVQLIILAIFIIVGAFYVLKSPELSKIVKKLIAEDGSNISVSVGYRFNSIVNLFNNRSILEIIIGSGRGSQAEYYTAIFYVAYAHGVLGVLLFLNIFIQALHCYNTSFQKVTTWIVLLMAIGSEMVVNFGIMTYFVFILTYNTNSTQYTLQKDTLDMIGE